MVIKNISYSKEKKHEEKRTKRSKLVGEGRSMSSGTDRNGFRRKKGVNKISKDRLDMTQNGKEC